jgi:hypothetical protein
LICLLLATTLWFLIRKNIATTQSSSDYTPARATQRH